MARPFFDIENGSVHRDGTGSGCPGPDEVRTIAVRTPTGIAAEQLARHDRQRVAVTVRGAAAASVLAMTLTPTTAWSNRAEA